MPSNPEEWRPVLGFEGLYEVSSVGRVRRLAGVDGIGRPRPARMVRPCPTNNGGHLRVMLFPGNGAVPMRVHRLVAEAWHGPRPQGLEINHIDGDKLNNTPGNLEYITPAENNAHAVRLKLHAYGERTGNSYMFEPTIIKIRRLYREGMKATEIGKLYGMKLSAVQTIVERRTWAHVEA